MLNKDDLRIMIADVLKRLGMYSETATELLMGTCAVESDFGRSVEQVGGGPALGVFQMEPNTMNDIWYNYIRYREGLRVILADEFGMRGPDKEKLKNDIEYSIVMASLKYRRSSLVLPKSDKDIEGLARVWKKVYNTDLGKGTVEKFVSKYKKYCV